MPNPKALNLMSKMWPAGIAPADYERVATLIEELAPAPVRPPVVAAPPPARSPAPKRKPGRPAKPQGRPPVAAVSKPTAARAALSHGPLTSKQLVEAIGGTTNVFGVIKSVGAVDAGRTEEGEKLYGLPAQNTEQAAPFGP